MTSENSESTNLIKNLEIGIPVEKAPIKKYKRGNGDHQIKCFPNEHQLLYISISLPLQGFGIELCTEWMIIEIENTKQASGQKLHIEQKKGPLPLSGGAFGRFAPVHGCPTGGYSGY